MPNIKPDRIVILLFSIMLVFSCGDEETGLDPAVNDNGDPETGGTAAAPLITDFSLPDGNLTDTGTIQISITDDGTATAWMITESENAPAASSSGWLSSKPSTHTISSIGAYNLYAWAKNSTGTVSSGKGPLSAEYMNGPEAGNVIITEIMADPNILQDTEGEWFEIYNTANETFNLKGCVFSDDGTDSFTVSEDFELTPYSYATFARSAAPGFTADYICQNFSLANSGDEITLTSLSDIVIDSVSYDSSVAGVSTQLLPSHFNSVDNDEPSNWTASTSSYNDDLGTPGAANEGIAPPALFFSEYIEGSGLNKALEIYNGTGSSLELTDWLINVYSNGSSEVSVSIALSTTTLSSNDVWTIGNTAFDEFLYSDFDQISADLSFNGDDTVELVYSGITVDIIGQIGTDPGSSWISGGVSTENQTIRRNMAVTVGDSNGLDAFDPSAEWDAFAQDTVDGLGTR